MFQDTIKFCVDSMVVFVLITDQILKKIAEEIIEITKNTIETMYMQKEYMKREYMKRKLITINRHINQNVSFTFGVLENITQLEFT